MNDWESPAGNLKWHFGGLGLIIDIVLFVSASTFHLDLGS